MSASRAAIETAIRDEIRCAQADRPTPKAGWEPQVDSLVMVSIVLRLEEDFSIVLPEEVMPPGGFDSEDHCVAVFADLAMKKLPDVSQEQREEEKVR